MPAGELLKPPLDSLEYVKAMTTMVYNIPVQLIATYRGRKVIVRSHGPMAIVKSLDYSDLENLVAVQLLSLITDIEALANWGYGVPVELVIDQPEINYPILYRHAKLLDKHPIRACIPVVHGFSKAVKVATSLQFLVKLEIQQPDAELVEELREVMEFYLHHPSVSQPIEFFHSTLLSLYDRHPVTLWNIQEEDPAILRFVTDDGLETVARPPMIVVPDPDVFLANLQKELLEQRAECCGCEFFDNCGGYFKWPQREYSCSGIKTLFQGLRKSADELGRDLDAYARAGAVR